MSAEFWVGPHAAPDTFQLVSMLGGGGEGEVWSAVLPLSAGGRRTVAVKIMPGVGVPTSSTAGTGSGTCCAASATRAGPGHRRVHRSRHAPRRDAPAGSRGGTW